MQGKIENGIARAWNTETARSNLDRWLSVCEKEGWGEMPENIDLLIQVFGASWYFTRFIFFRGCKVACYFDEPRPDSYPRAELQDRMFGRMAGDDVEQKMDSLRMQKNEVMLQVLLEWLSGNMDQENMEVALTNLAEAALWCAMRLLIEEHDYTNEDIATLAMGRMAGYEMNFGSDLDLIFIYSGRSPEESSTLVKQIQLLLRHIAVASPAGILYEIDMRLRPHGTSGTLITPANYFIEYHTTDREIWERQMMTRCRPVIDDEDGLAEESLATVREAIYHRYDERYLRDEIIAMRRRVESELGNPKGKYEIKRGRGGIMDIDFLTHYFQLLHGHENQQLRTTSTREALRQCEASGLIKTDQCNELLQAYNFMKRIECSLRVTDLKSISAFSQQPEAIVPLARSMGFAGDHGSEQFLEQYNRIAGSVRNHFETLVGKIS